MTGEMVDDYVAYVGNVLGSRRLDQVVALGGDSDDRSALVGAAPLAYHQAAIAEVQKSITPRSCHACVRYLDNPAPRRTSETDL